MTTPDECQSPGEGDSAFWADRKRAEDLSRIYRHVLDSPEGVSLAYLVKTLYSYADVENSSANYQRVRRFVHDAADHELFEIDHRDHSLWVEPTPEAYRSTSLDTASKHTAGTQDGDGVALSNAKAMLRRRRTLSEPETRGDLLGAFAAKREATDDRFHALEDTLNRGQHLLVPYSTRFNSERRVAKTRERFRTGWSRAAEQFQVGVVATLTTDPSRYESLLAATEDLLDDVDHLKRWLAYSPAEGPARPGHRPPAIVVPEFTDDGKPHVHVAFFGVGWLTTQQELSRYWNKERGRGKIVWLDRIANRDGRWRWVESRGGRDHPDTANCPPRSYLEEGIDLLEASANASAEDLKEAAAALRQGQVEEVDEDLESAHRRGEQLWKAALYWATELPVFTLSPTLRATDREDEGRATAPDGTPLPEDAPSRYRYVGTARYGRFPGHIRDGAIVLTRNRSRQTGQPPPEPDLEPGQSHPG